MKASIFDIDGTLVKGLMIYEFLRHLLRIKMIDEKVFKEINNWVKLYLNGKTTYRKIAVEIPSVYSKGIKGFKEDDIKKEAIKFVDFYLKKFIQPYTM
jgi:phosphoglycolate phosphatase-like HAD superfamily hydrolase